jgi:predicted DNA-binding transcriptional regulator AlpA
MKNANIAEQIAHPGWQERLLSRKLLRQLMPVSDMTIWRWERDGTFPKHLTINGRNYWLFRDVMSWLEIQKSRSLEKVKNG